MSKNEILLGPKMTNNNDEEEKSKKKTGTAWTHKNYKWKFNFICNFKK